jgi:ABC-type multidrug transport system ATPase subunit
VTAGIKVLTTHYLDEAKYVNRIAIVDHGRIVALDTPEALKRGVGADTRYWSVGGSRQQVGDWITG